MPTRKMATGRPEKNSTLPARAVDGFGEKTLTRRRHQDGQLIETKHGWAVRFYEQGEGKRHRIQKFLGSFDEMTKPQAKTAMQETLAAVNRHVKALPQQSTETFRTYAERWLTECIQRKQKPIKPSVASGWRRILKNHLLDAIGDLPLASVGNKTMRSVVERLANKGLAPATIRNITLVVKLVVASAVDDDGNQLFPMKWNGKFIDAPPVDGTKQRKPTFTSAEVETIVKAATGRMQMIAILFAATGLRAGELLGLECRHFDGASITVNQAVWHARVQAPKTQNANRIVDLHPDVAALLKTFIGNRSSGFIFQVSSGRPVSQVNLLCREFHPLLETLGISMRGFHAFRRFRVTHLRQQHCPDGLLKFWSGHAEGDMTDHYDLSRSDVQYRRDVARAMGVGFELPKTLTGKEKGPFSDVIGRQAETVNAG